MIWLRIYCYFVLKLILENHRAHSTTYFKQKKKKKRKMNRMRGSFLSVP